MVIRCRFISSEIVSAYVLPEKYVYPLIPVRTACSHPASAASAEAWPVGLGHVANVMLKFNNLAGDRLICTCSNRNLSQGDLDAVDMPTGILLVKIIEATDIPNMVRLPSPASIRRLCKRLLL